MQIIQRVTVMQVLTENSKKSCWLLLKKERKSLSANATSSIFSSGNTKRNTTIRRRLNHLKKKLKNDRTRLK